MKKKRYILMTSFAAAVLLAFSACSQDEIVGGGDSLLPDGAYPLKIGSVSIVAQSSEEPWTRVAENTTDGGSSVWETGDVIGVRFDGAPSYYGGTPPYTVKGEYVFQKTGEDLYLSFVAGKEIYWKNTYGINSQDKYDNKTWYTGGVTAWYPTNESVELDNQSERLAYILEGHEKTPDNNGHYRPDDEIPLEFKHLLAKVRVELKGERATAVNKVEVYSYTSCTHSEVGPTLYTRPYRKISTDEAQQGWITMHKATYTDGNTYWEANLVPGTIQNNFVRLNGTTEVPLSTLTELKAGNLHTVTVTVSAWPSSATQITSSTGNISDNGNYYVTGNLASAINITGGSPHIYLYNANVTNSAAGSAISITDNATPTIHVVGENTIEAASESLSNYAAGIYVAQGSSVTIEGRGTDNILKVTGGTDGAAIGGYSPDMNTHNPCGDITIRNVTLYAYASGAYMNNLPIGIGSTGTAACGKIEITDAIVHARGYGTLNESTPAIGAYSRVPQIVVSGSTIHAHRGSYNNSCYADYIGQGGHRYGYQGGQMIQCGSGGSITGSTVYKYSYDLQTDSSSDDGSVTF